MIAKNSLSKEMLEYWYGKLGSMQKVANHFEISADSVRNYAKKYNLNYSKTFRGIYYCDESFFERETPESFYLAGFIAADGSVQYRKYSKILKISLALKDKSHLEKIKNLLGSSHPIKEYPTKRGAGKKTFSVELAIANAKLVDSLRKFNIVPNKTLTYQMPEWLLNHPLVSHFMRGYFDGDGCIYLAKQIKPNRAAQLSWSVLGTENFVKQYSQILLEKANLGINPRKHASIYMLKTSGNKMVKKIREFLYRDASVFLERKFQKFEIPSNFAIVLKLPQPITLLPPTALEPGSDP